MRERNLETWKASDEIIEEDEIREKESEWEKEKWEEEEEEGDEKKKEETEKTKQFMELEGSTAQPKRPPKVFL